MTPMEIRRRTAELMRKEPEQVADTMTCAHAGCRVVGTIDLGRSGRFLCSEHAFKPSEHDAETIARKVEQLRKRWGLK